MLDGGDGLGLLISAGGAGVGHHAVFRLGGRLGDDTSVKGMRFGDAVITTVVGTGLVVKCVVAFLGRPVFGKMMLDGGDSFGLLISADRAGVGHHALGSFSRGSRDDASVEGVRGSFNCAAFFTGPRMVGFISRPDAIAVLAGNVVCFGLLVAADRAGVYRAALGRGAFIEGMIRNFAGVALFTGAGMLSFIESPRAIDVLAFLRCGNGDRFGLLVPTDRAGIGHHAFTGFRRRLRNGSFIVAVVLCLLIVAQFAHAYVLFACIGPRAIDMLAGFFCIRLRFAGGRDRLGGRLTTAAAGIRHNAFFSGCRLSGDHAFIHIVSQRGNRLSGGLAAPAAGIRPDAFGFTGGLSGDYALVHVMSQCGSGLHNRRATFAIGSRRAIHGAGGIDDVRVVDAVRFRDRAFRNVMANRAALAMGTVPVVYPTHRVRAGQGYAAEGAIAVMPLLGGRRIGRKDVQSIFAVWLYLSRHDRQTAAQDQ